jgi:transposase
LSLYIYDAQTSTDVKIKNEIKEIVHYFNKYKEKDVIVVLEPTGIYFQKLVKVLNDLSIDYFLIPLDVIHNLNKILGESNKNDKIDARKIANY